MIDIIHYNWHLTCCSIILWLRAWVDMEFSPYNIGNWLRNVLRKRKWFHLQKNQYHVVTYLLRKKSTLYPCLALDHIFTAVITRIRNNCILNWVFITCSFTFFYVLLDLDSGLTWWVSILFFYWQFTSYFRAWNLKWTIFSSWSV